MAKPIAPGLQTCTVCSPTECWRQLRKCYVCVCLYVCKHRKRRQKIQYKRLIVHTRSSHIYAYALSKNTGIATLSPDYRNYSVPFEPHETVMVHFDQNVVMHSVTVLGKFWCVKWRWHYYLLPLISTKSYTHWHNDKNDTAEYYLCCVKFLDRQDINLQMANQGISVCQRYRCWWSAEKLHFSMWENESCRPE